MENLDSCLFKERMSYKEESIMGLRHSFLDLSFLLFKLNSSIKTDSILKYN